ncbi:MAG: DsbA family protein [Acidimicrobiales bacterium]
MAPTSTLVHVADPMCSWCYAFGPELDQIRERTGMSVRVVMGGLFVADRRVPLDDGLRAYLRDTWTRVSDISGRPVSFDLLDRVTWIYDTEPACQAFVAARLDGRSDELSVFDDMQQAFYADGRDLTDLDVLGEVVQLPPARLGSSEVAKATNSDFVEASTLGAAGYPTLLIDNGDEAITVSAGFQRADRILRTLEVLVPDAMR